MLTTTKFDIHYPITEVFVGIAQDTLKTLRYQKLAKTPEPQRGDSETKIPLYVLTKSGIMKEAATPQQKGNQDASN